MIKMRKLILTFSLMSSTHSFAQSASTLCPAILESARIQTSYSKKQLAEVIGLLTKEKDSPVESIEDIETKRISALDKSVFRVSIEQLDSKTNTITSKMAIDCPTAKSWKLQTLPDISLQKPKNVKDAKDPIFANEKASLIRNGLRLTRFFGDLEEYFSITLFWNVFSQSSKAPSDLPSFFDSENVSHEVLSLGSAQHPVRGLRFSTTGKFGNVWYLATKKALSQMKEHSFLDPIVSEEQLTESFANLTARTLSTSSLEIYDSVNRKFFQCSDILAKERDGNCLHYNYQLNPQLWEYLEKGESVWMQIIVELSTGYLIQTYTLDGSDNSNPTLIKQKYAENLEELNIPQNLIN